MEMMKSNSLKLAVALAFLGAMAAVPVLSRQDAGSQFRANRMPPGARYEGASRCITCHADKASQLQTPMGRALELVRDCRNLQSNPALSFKLGPYTFRITSDGKTSTYTVTDGKNTFSEPILYAFGQGDAGQTYVFRHNGAFYESRVSFYKDINGLDLTIGYPSQIPKTVEDAAGRPTGHDEIRDCFGCHATATVSQGELNLEKMIPGVSCEACHGPGAEHVKSASAADYEHTHIFNPGSLNTEEISNFCGACHRTWDQVTMMKLQDQRDHGQMGVRGVRFQPYRLTDSKCYEADDRRISCLACHDPHKPRKREPAFFDAKCTACHQSDEKAARSGQQIAKLCPVGKQNCVTCHMPKIELPGSHFKFTDHRIRVVRAGDPYPE